MVLSVIHLITMEGNSIMWSGTLFYSFEPCFIPLAAGLVDLFIDSFIYVVGDFGG